MATSGAAASAPPQSRSSAPGLTTFSSLSTADGALRQGVDRVVAGTDDYDQRRLLNIAYGVREDCSKLLQNFDAKESLRFQDFSACWRDMMFSHILSGRTNLAERIEFLQKFMTIVVRLFVAAQDIFRRVGALYLMYSVYLKLGRAERTMVSIRITPLAWTQLKQVRQQAVQQNHHDVLFVIDRLIFVSAFTFVAHEVEMAPDLVYRTARTVCIGSDDEGDEEESPLQEYLDDGGLQQLSTLHKKYEAIKLQVFKGSKSGRLSSLGADVVPNILGRLEALAKGKPMPEESATAANAAGVPEKKQPSTLSGRQSARERAFARFKEDPQPQPKPQPQQQPQPKPEPQTSQDQAVPASASSEDETDETEPPLSIVVPIRGRGSRRKAVQAVRSVGAGKTKAKAGGLKGRGRGRIGRPKGRGSRGLTRFLGAAMAAAGRGAGPSRSGGDLDLVSGDVPVDLTESPSRGRATVEEGASSTRGRGGGQSSTRGRGRSRGRGRGRGRPRGRGRGRGRGEPHSDVQD